jgi:hypothetical protein
MSLLACRWICENIGGGADTNGFTILAAHGGRPITRPRSTNPPALILHGRTEHEFNPWRVLRSSASQRGESPHNTSVLFALKL